MGSKGVAVVLGTLSMLAILMLLINKARDFFTIDNDVPAPLIERYFLPQLSAGKIIHHDYFSLQFNEESGLADWVAYPLTIEMLKTNKLPREGSYVPDPNLDYNIEELNFYGSIGLERGHLVPVADMSFSKEAMRQTFFMSNICPQQAQLNSGLWLELEVLIRKWVMLDGKLFIIAGPLYLHPENENSFELKGVPDHFYKIVLDLELPVRKGIGFILPNGPSGQKLLSFAVNIDSIETLTRFNFFPGLMTGELEQLLESEFNSTSWGFK